MPTPLEELLMQRLLQADFPGKETVAHQLAKCEVRTIDSYGSLELCPQIGNPAALPNRFITGFLDFARNDSKIKCMSEFQFGGEFVWYPSPELIAQSNLQQFIDKHQLGSYDQLMQRSTTDITWFWDTVLRDLDVKFYKPYSRVVDLSDGKPWAHWCVDGEMNIVHNLLDKYADTPTDELKAICKKLQKGDTEVEEMSNNLLRKASGWSQTELDNFVQIAMKKMTKANE